MNDSGTRQVLFHIMDDLLHQQNWLGLKAILLAPWEISPPFFKVSILRMTARSKNNLYSEWNDLFKRVKESLIEEGLSENDINDLLMGMETK